ncbi:AAA domain-containing protein [Arcticibacter tournemirensis]|uniref:AAA family ATPase n=1 Tax=Arcticibacter tournemirensis TaxID=699437 RepID=A0A5M9GWC2_9SPHI|nr:AAA family ATPase [Arcticibacter tournemirensis]KAA8478219.1 AAA family ATPase [Arcticibacter tournemirensis]TQM50756.1 AAA domain-containing protein [Arcticibacter tournemirensis]
MKIKRIHISNYRAFLINDDQEASRYTLNLPNGENLLIYGENGSGKSSLFRALKDFFNAVTNPQPFQKNLFYEARNTSEPPFIDIEIDDNSHHRFSSDGNQYLLVNNESGVNTNYITQANIINGFISYRDLLKLHFRQDNQNPDLVSLFLGQDGLFSDMVVPAPAQPENKITYKNLWIKCGGLDQEALTDYNTNVTALFGELEAKANMLLGFFHKECSLKIEYTDGVINDNTLNNPTISFKVKLFGKELPEHDDMLNEARLTAIAISVFMAHQLCIPPAELRILFLDDIFIGLDMTNRIPLLKILTADNLGDGSSFKDAQIFLTTYDREWFNIAKPYLEGWEKTEFYVDNHSHDIERPFIRKSDTYRERAEYHLTKGDYPACANYLRKAFEKELKRILPENVLYPGFSGTSGDNSVVALSKRSLSISENDNAWFYKLKEEEDTAVDTFRFISLQQMIDQFKKLVNQYEIPFLLIDELTGIKNRLLNPLSHDDLKSSIFKAELITGFKILDELQKIISKVILSVKNTDAIQMYSIKKDYKNDLYYYRFEILENLRIFQYNTFRVLLNSNINSQYRAKEYKNFEVLEKNYISLKKLCEGIFFLSDVPGAVSSFYENFIFDEIYTAEGEKISELI